MQEQEMSHTNQKIKSATKQIHFESFLITFDWLEKNLNRKPASTEMSM